MVFKPQFHFAGEFEEGMAKVYTRERATGYINKSGEYVCGPLN